jgi:hypothetical protein
MSKPAPYDDPARLTRQLALDLTLRRRGGPRPGSGRPRVKDEDRGFIAHSARPSHRKGDPVHITLRVKKGVPSLRRQSLERIVKRALVTQREALDETGAKHFQVVHLTIQSDHLHLIVEAPDKRGLARGVAGLEIRIARGCSAWGGRQHGLLDPADAPASGASAGR